MDQTLEVSESIIVNASADKVWNALTDPSLIKDYLFGTETITDWQVGSEIIFQGVYGEHSYRDKGVIKENRKNERLSYSYWSGFSGLEDKPENYSLVTYNVERVDDTQTKFTWIQKGFADKERYEHSKTGMKDFLLGVKTVMER